MTDVRWHRAWSLGTLPSTTEGQLLRSYYYFSGYASAVKANTTASTAAFSLDFVVHYAFEPTAGGASAIAWPNGVAALQSTRTKLVMGYPSGLYASNDSRRYLMHQTGPLPYAFFTGQGNYLRVLEVSTGPGNSGGPIWVNDGAQYLFAGIVIAGSHRSLGSSIDQLGVYGVNAASIPVIDPAMFAVGGLVSPPVIVAQPTSRRILAGEAATFSVSATGLGLSYRWTLNGAALPSETSSTLALKNVTFAQAGTYRAIVSNSGGEVVSVPATLAVDASSRLVNVSTRGMVPAGGALTPGFVLRGAGSKQLVIRAVGPSLSQFGLAAVALPDPLLTVIPAGSAVPIAGNDDWNGAAALSSAFSSVGAFALSGLKDAALKVSTPVNSGGYTARVTAGGAGGIAIAEIYDADADSAPSRIVNVSTLGFAGRGENALTPGFVVRGTGMKQLLIRVIGHSLGQFGVGDRLVDPQVQLFPLGGSTVIASNNDWGGTASLKAAFAAAGAFGLVDDTRDAALVVSLAPGGYTVAVSGVDNAQGTVLVEIYDLDP